MAFIIISVGALVLLSNKELVMYIFLNFFFFEKLYVLYFIFYFPTRLKMIDEFRLLLGVSGLFVLDIINY